MAGLGSGFGTRLATGLLMAAVILSCIWIEAIEIGLYVLIVAVVGVGLHEYYSMIRAKGIALESKFAVIVGIVIAISGVLGEIAIVNATLVAGCICVVFLQLIRPGVTIATVVSSAGGLLYIGWTGAHAILTHRIDDVGAGLLTVMIVAVALTDCGAFFVGKAIGKHKLAPIVSPNKTWEGAIGGFVFTGIGMAVLWKLRESQEWLSYPDWPVLKYFVTGAVLSIASQVGDLTESAMKRDAEIKDSGSILPGHGGVLDRCDGFLFAAPVLYYLAIL